MERRRKSTVGELCEKVGVYAQGPRITANRATPSPSGTAPEPRRAQYRSELDFILVSAASARSIDEFQ